MMASASEGMLSNGTTAGDVEIRLLSQASRSLIVAVLLGAALMISCYGGAWAAQCVVPTGSNISYLPVTTPPKFLMPLPEPGKTLPEDCPFYQQAWQTFLYVSQSKGGKPAFLSYPTFESLFKQKATPLFADQKPGMLSLAPRSIQLPNASVPPDSDLDIQDIFQAAGSTGLQKVLVDQNKNLIWYTIHVNDAFADFLKDYDLTKLNVLKQIPSDLEFRAGVVELKSAWQIVEGPKPNNYITAAATIPVFKVGDDGKITIDGGKTRDVTVALLSLHVVTLLEGHPEFIWATFEHVTHQPKGWIRDVAPSATDNPDKSPVLVDTRLPKYSLYPVTSTTNPAVPVDRANVGNKLGELKLDVAGQKFSPITPVYRIFPASKSDTNDEDEEVASLNDSVKQLFEKLNLVERDVRSNYQLVGAVWLNTPHADLTAGQIFSDVPPVPPRDPPLFGGENRLSNMALESFTQPTNKQPNCFSCHDTSTAGLVNKLSASRLNVSHILSKFFDLQKINP